MNATVVSQPQQTVITPPGTVATTIPGTNAVVITQAPPATRPQEVVVAQPSPQHVWIEGYWTWQSGRYVWVAGHWEVPPRSGAIWVPPVTQRRDNEYVFQEGYWK